MASEPGPPEKTGQPPARAPMPKRTKKKLVIVSVAVVAAAVILFWGWSSNGQVYLDVATLVDESSDGVPNKYAGETLEVRGVVSGWSGADDLEFILVDQLDANKTISVTMSGAYPEGFENLKPVVVTGELSPELPLSLNATDVTVSCSSKGY